MLCSVMLAVGGILLARKVFNRKIEGDPMKRALGPVHRLLYHKYYVDEFYNKLFVERLVKGSGSVLGRFDASVIDGAVNGAGWLTRFTSTMSIWWDTWIVDGTVRLMAFVIRFASYPMRMVQTGMLQNYAFVIVLSALTILIYYLF